MSNPFDGSGPFTLIGIVAAAIYYLKTVPEKEIKEWIGKKYDPSKKSKEGNNIDDYCKKIKRNYLLLIIYSIVELFLAFFIICLSVRILESVCLNSQEKITNNAIFYIKCCSLYSLLSFIDVCLAIILCFLSLGFFCIHLWFNGKDIRDSWINRKEVDNNETELSNQLSEYNNTLNEKKTRDTHT